MKDDILKLDLSCKSVSKKIRTCECYICKHSTYKKSLIKCNLDNCIVPLEKDKCYKFELNPMILAEPHLICKLCDHCIWKHNESFGEEYPYCDSETKRKYMEKYMPQITSINCPCDEFKITNVK